MKLVRSTVDAPANLGIAVIGVPPNSPVRLNLRLESVVEGVLVTGTAVVQVRGECVRCLGAIAAEQQIDIQELYVYPDSDITEDEASRLEGDLLDLEPLLRDDVVLDLPFQPLCRDECRGLCVECGADLNEDPDHSHESRIDSRWEKLRTLEANEAKSYDVTRK
jgi:DUF177 domain-containing protein